MNHSNLTPSWITGRYMAKILPFYSQVRSLQDYEIQALGETMVKSGMQKATEDVLSEVPCDPSFLRQTAFCNAVTACEDIPDWKLYQFAKFQAENRQNIENGISAWYGLVKDILEISYAYDPSVVVENLLEEMGPVDAAGIPCDDARDVCHEQFMIESLKSYASAKKS